MAPETRAWVRLVDGRFVVTWQVATPDGGWRPGGTRPLTRREQALWRAAKRVPKVP